MTSQIRKSLDLSKIQKTKFLENKALLFLQINKIVYYKLRAIINQTTVF